MQPNQVELSPPLPQPPLSHHNYHYHPPLSPPLSQPPTSQRQPSQPPQLMNAYFHIFHFRFLKEVSQESFVFTSSTFTHFGGSLALKLRFLIFNFQFLREVSHESFFFTSSTFSSNNSFRKNLSPAMSCACLLLILDGQRAARKTAFQRAMGQRLADRYYVFFPTLTCGVFVFSSVSAFRLPPPAASRPLTHTHPLTHPLTHSHSLTLTHSLTHSHSHSLTHTLTHSFTHSHTLTLPMLVRCPCCPLSGLIVCLCCHVNAQPLPAVHGGALQQTNLFNWRLPVQETVAHLLVLKTCYSRRLNQASFI